MAERTVSVALQAQVAGFVAGMRTAGRSVQQFASRMDDRIQRNRQALDSLTTGTAVLGAGMVAAAGLAVKTFADFERAMSAVQAATGESAASMDRLKEAALDAGQRTSFSATEAAGAIEQLAKAGVSAEDILAGGLDGALALAAAGQVKVGEAAETAASAMTQFGLSGQEVPHVADLLAAAAGKAQGGVRELSEALSQSGLVASQMGLSIEETTGALAAFASAGLLGSDAGTSFKTMLLRLASPTAEVAEEMERLGITAYDSSGQFVGLEKLAGELRTSLSGLSEQQRNAALATIFGTDAIRSANILYRQGADGIEQWTEKVNDQGYAAEVAATKMDNLAGDLEQLRGSIETALIQLGEGAGGPLRSLVQSLEDAVNEFNRMSDGAQSATLAIVGGGGLVLLGIAGLAKLATTISDTRAAMQDLGLSGRRVGRILKFAGVAGAVVGVGAAIQDMALKMQGVRVDAKELQESLDAWAGEGAAAGEVAKLLGDDMSNLDRAFHSLMDDPTVYRRIVNFGDRMIPLSGTLDRAKERMAQLDEALASLASSGNAEEAAAIFEEIKDRAKEQGLSVERVKELFPEYEEELKRATAENEKTAEAMKGSGNAAKQQEEETSAAADALEEMESRATELDDALTVLNATMGNVEAESAYEQAIDDATERLKEYREGVREGDIATKGMKNALDLSTQAGRDNAESLRNLWQRSSEYATKTLEVTGSQKQANQVLKQGREELVDVATEFLGSRKKAEEYITEVLGIPKDVSTAIKQPGIHAARDNAKDLDGKTRNIPNAVKTWISAPGIHNVIDWVGDLIGEIDNIPTYKEVQIEQQVNREGGRYATGGYVAGPGTGTSDSIPARLSDGEYVVRAAAVSKYGTAMLSAINGMQYASGGYVGMRMAQGGAVSTGSDGGEQVTYNFYPRSVDVDERTIGTVIRTARLRDRIGRPR